MIVTLMMQERLMSIKLPEICIGKYWLEDENGKRLFAIEADSREQKWCVSNDLTYTLYNSSQKEVDELWLNPGELNIIQFGVNQDNIAFVFAESEDAGESTYVKYKVTQQEIKLGRSGNDCDILIDNGFVSGVHCKLTFQGNNWHLYENEMTNGIYVDGKRFHGDDSLDFGSCVYVFGTKIILENGFIAINNPSGKTTVQGDNLKRITFDNYLDNSASKEYEENYYYRSPRFIKALESFDLKVDMPTQAEKIDDTPIMLTLAPSMVMGVASFSTGIITLVTTMQSDRGIMAAIPTLLMSISMLAGMIIFPFIMKKRDNKNKRNKENLRKDKYMKYLTTVKNEVERAKRRQVEILNENNPPILDKTRQADFWKTGLFSKSEKDEDFLFFRMGVGNVPMLENIEFPEERFTLDDDDMRDALLRFQKEEKLLLNVPVGIDMKKSSVVDINGNKNNVINAINIISMQIALLHGYDEVKICFIGKNETIEKIGYLKNINHIWNNDKTYRFLATNEEEISYLNSAMSDILKKRADREINPYLIVLVNDRRLAKKADFLREIDFNEDDRVKIIYCYDDDGEIPRKCDTVVKLDMNSALIYGDNIANYNGISFVQDTFKITECVKTVDKSLKYKLSINEGANNLPATYGFMEMFGVGKSEHLNIMHRWESNDPTKSLRAEVGVDPSGEKFYLDLHEKYHGPHGLVAGMTGSGKSEFIITYILSMAINYSPDEVAFVLIDYKGGGLAGAFENANYRLPHLAGTITNLDSSAVYRSILSIKSELKKRQAIFNEVKASFNEGTMDIYKYQKLYRAGKVQDPMPHLFIISDEFAELKSQQPEFMDELISTARIGRSLGVHLILATQKPSGVVNDQIWANSKFKVCLKVQDKSDSMEMLKRPEAAELVNTGRFYLQVGYNEAFLIGQSAWSGAKYPDSDEYEAEGNNDIDILDMQGQVVDVIKVKQSEDKDKKEQIVCIMQYLDKLASELNISEKQLWMPEIPELIYLDELLVKYGVPDTDKLFAVAGEMDDPYNQAQKLLTVNFEEQGNLIAYGNSNSGVGLFVETVLFSMFELFAPDEFSTYLLDFENESMKKFENIPHVGAVILDGEDEKINNFFSIMAAEIQRRKRMLSGYTSINEYNENNQNKLSKMLIVVSNYAHFAECYERFEDSLIQFSRDGMKYGIYMIVTAMSSSSIRYRVAQNFNQSFVFKLNDRSDYATILGSTNGIIPSKNYGAGILKDKEVYSLQTAHYIYEDTDEKEFIANFAEAVKTKYVGLRAPRIPVMPETISLDDFELKVDGSDLDIPVGIEFGSYEKLAVNLRTALVMAVSAAKQNMLDAYINCVEQYIKGLDNYELTVLDSEAKEDSYSLDGCLEAVMKEAIERNKNKDQLDAIKPRVVLVKSYKKVLEALTPSNQNDFKDILSSVSKLPGLMFIIADLGDNMSAFSTESWMLSLGRKSMLWIGDGIKQYASYLGLNPYNLQEKMQPRSGILVLGDEYRNVRVLLKEDEKNE